MRRSLHAMVAMAFTSLLLAGCGRTANNDSEGAAANGSAANVARPAANEGVAGPASNETAAALPANFPGRDREANGADCYVYLSMAMQTPGNSAGFDNVALGQARDQWRSELRLRLSETETQQLTASNVNPLAGTPAAQRDAAAHWCVEHSPVVDPA